MTLEHTNPPPPTPVNDVNSVTPVKTWAETAQKWPPTQHVHENPICEEFGIPWTDFPHAQ